MVIAGAQSGGAVHQQTAGQQLHRAVGRLSSLQPWARVIGPRGLGARNRPPVPINPGPLLAAWSLSAQAAV